MKQSVSYTPFLLLSSAHATTRAGGGINDELHAIAGLARIIREPGRLIIVARLAFVKTPVEDPWVCFGIR